MFPSKLESYVRAHLGRESHVIWTVSAEIQRHRELLGEDSFNRILTVLEELNTSRDGLLKRLNQSGPQGYEIWRLKAIIQTLQTALKQKNKELDSLHYIWDSTSSSGAHRWSRGPLTKELVRIAERQVKRMRTWVDNNIY